MNNKGGGITEVLSLGPVVLGLVGWAVWFGIETGNWLWCITMSIILLVVVVMEIISYCIHKKTISQIFWAFCLVRNENGKLKNRWKAWTMMGMLLTGIVFLIIHLIYKLI